MIFHSYVNLPEGISLKSNLYLLLFLDSRWHTYQLPWIQPYLLKGSMTGVWRRFGGEPYLLRQWAWIHGANLLMVKVAFVVYLWKTEPATHWKLLKYFFFIFLSFWLSFYLSFFFHLCFHSFFLSFYFSFFYHFFYHFIFHFFSLFSFFFHFFHFFYHFFYHFSSFLLPVVQKLSEK